VKLSRSGKLRTVEISKPVPTIFPSREIIDSSV
jgi:hypothetical protein